MVPTRPWIKGIVTVSLILASVATSRAITPTGLERNALAAMERGAYEEATEIFSTLLDRVPGAPRTLYNLACCASRLEDPDQAADSLQAAWDAGFRDLELIRTDPDLQNMRSSRRGRRLIERLEKAHRHEQRLRGSPLLFETSVLASARVVAPEVMRPDHRYPLVVVLHGRGGSGERFAGLFVAAGLSPDVIVMAPQGPYPTHQLNGFGFSWFPPVELFKELTTRDGATTDVAAHRQSDLEVYERAVSRNHVLAAIDEVIRTYPINPDQVFVLGFSEGGVVAYDLALNHPNRFQGLVSVGTYLPRAIASPDVLAAAKGQIRALVCHSPEDEAVSIDDGKSAYKRLREAGITSRFVRYDGGHRLSAELLATIVKWIDGAPVDQAPPQSPQQ